MLKWHNFHRGLTDVDSYKTYTYTYEKYKTAIDIKKFIGNMIVIFQVEKQKRLKNQPFLFYKFF